MCLCAHVLMYVGLFLLSAAQLIVFVSGTHYMIENQKQLEIHGAKRDLITRNIRDMVRWEANCTEIDS